MKVSIGSPPSGRDGGSADRRGERGVSPVIAVVVLLGVTVVLGLTIGPFVLGTMGDLARDTPEGDFAFFYEQDVDSDRIDDFGNQISGSDGLMVVKMESDTTLDPGNIEVQTATSGGNLLTDTPDDVYASGDRLRQGDTIDIAAARGETVQAIWVGPDGEQSTVLTSLTVPQVDSSVPPGVPTPTLECDWLNEETQSGTLDVEQGDEFQENDVLACDSFDSIVTDTVDIDGDLAVVADIAAADVDLQDGSFQSGGNVYGSIESTEDVELSALTVTGRVTAADELTLDAVTVENSINATGTASISDSTVDGNVVAGSDLTLDNTTVTGDVEVAGSLTCTGGSTIAGEDCADYRDAKFDIDITATTWPGVEDETVRVEAVAENVRIDDGDRTLELVVDGTTYDTTDISNVGSDQSELVVLEWTPGSDAAGEHVVTVETNASARDDLDSRPVDVVETLDGLPTINEFTAGTGDDSITVDWNVSAGDVNLSVVTVTLHDAEGNAAGEETWFLNGDEATGSVTLTGLDEETHSIKLDVSDQNNNFERRIKLAKPN